MNKAAATLESVKTDFKKRVDEFNAAIKKMESQGGSQVQDLIAKHKKEMAEHVTANNAKYNEMLKERMNAEDKLQEEVDRLKRELAAAAAKAMKDAEAEIAKRVRCVRKRARERVQLLAHQALSHQCIRPQATDVCGLSHSCMRH